MNKFLKSLISSGTAAILGTGSVSVAQVKQPEAPPQFVMLAFDGSFSLDFWKESRAFAQKARESRRPLNWTYFISGVYWIHEGNYALYVPPHKQAAYPSRAAMQADVRKRLVEANNMNIPKETRKAARRGWSDIGFGNDVNDVAERIRQVNLAALEDHEIASHANGHFVAGSSRSDSRKWNYQQWLSEFDQFTDLIFNAYENNGLANNSNYSTGNAFVKQDIVGFRAPTLDTNLAMFQVLADSGFTYDTSGKNSGAETPTKWPEKNSLGTWMFPLGHIQIVGTSKKTASMDYNFFVMQSREKEDKANKDFYRDQMYDSYMKYFNDNYYGNRAPIHIGHHFSKWNGGAYWEAMQRFAWEVCGKPQVRCVTYKEYVAWLESQSQSKLAAFGAGAFPQTPRPAGLKALEVVGQSTPLMTLENGVLKAAAKMDRLSKVLDYKLGLKIDNSLQEKNTVTLADLRQSAKVGSKVAVSAVVLNSKGHEVDSFTVLVKDIGTDKEVVDMSRLEDKARLGDLSEAHEHE